MEALYNSPFFGIALSAAAFCIGWAAQKKTRLTICNPLLIAVVLIIAVLLVFKIPYEHYYRGGVFIDMLLTPATACLGISIYSRLETLKKHWLPILSGCVAGSAASMLSVWALCGIFRLDDALTRSLLPKSVTTPIAVTIAAEQGGIPPVTAAAVVFTGLLGSLLSPGMIKLFRLKNPIAAGLGIGACSHVGGTARALEIGETEGAMSSLAIGLCGIVTVILGTFFYALI
ncbi:MAG: LrgB family protein [Treponema sp.]|jgi:predicted murein hydrolase (TIGR00659 family)|nr:LrgB family protein [Treponema sp.]